MYIADRARDTADAKRRKYSDMSVTSCRASWSKTWVKKYLTKRSSLLDICDNARQSQLPLFTLLSTQMDAMHSSQSEGRTGLE